MVTMLKPLPNSVPQCARWASANYRLVFDGRSYRTPRSNHELEKSSLEQGVDNTK